MTTRRNAGLFPSIIIPLAILLSVACSVATQAPGITGAPAFERGFQLFPSPRTFDAPGTIFRVDRDGVRHPVADLSSMLTITPMDEAIPRITVRNALNVGAFVTWLGGGYRSAYEQGDSATVSISGARREEAFESALDKVVDSAARIIDWRKPGRVYVITETILADSVGIDVGARMAAALGDSVKGDSARARGISVQWQPSRSAHLSLRFPRPYRVLYKAEQLARRNELEEDTLPSLIRVPVQVPLVWHDLP